MWSTLGLAAAALGWAWGGVTADDETDGGEPLSWNAWQTVTAIAVTALVVLGWVATTSPRSVAGQYLAVVASLVRDVLRTLAAFASPLTSLLGKVF